MAARIRKKHSPELKAKVAREAMRGLKTVAELSAEFSVHPTQVNQWKKLAEEGLVGVFDSKNKKEQQRDDRSDLLEEIGRLNMELRWLKKKL